MSYIIMGIDECGSEFRAWPEEFDSEATAAEVFKEVEARYPEARSLWIEVYKDKAYYYREAMRREAMGYDPYDPMFDDYE